MGKRLLTPTLRDVASLADVSIPIVSKVLSGNPQVRVSAQTRRRIQKAAQRLSYRPNASARSLKVKRTFTLALFVPDVGNPVIPEIIRGVECGARERGYSAFVSHLDTEAIRDRLYLAWLQEGRFDGLIIATTRVEDNVIAELVRSGRPYVLVNRRAAATRRHITVDDEAGARAAVAHLAALGHRRIAHLAGCLIYDTALRRLEGYRQGLLAHGIPYDPRLVEEYEWHTWEGGQTAMNRLLRRKRRPTAVFAGNFMGAAGALSAIRAAGIKVPDEISIVGLHDSPMAEVLDPSLTVVRMPLYDMGRGASAMLIDLIEGCPGAAPVVLPCGELVIRKSTGPCPRGARTSTRSVIPGQRYHHRRAE
jgi:LacI family transcriptional regulator